jgi:thiol-disulfide isomerase/thioredoxin
LVAGGLITAAVAGALGIAAVRGAEEASAPVATAAPGGSTPTQVVSSGGGAQVGETAPQVKAQALEGQEVQLPAGEPTALFFFASWCGTCIAEAGALAQLHREHGSEVAIVAVDIDPSSTPEMAKEFMAAAGGATYPVVHDVDGSLVQAFEVSALDTTVITDAAGTVVYRDAAPTTSEQLRNGLREAGAQL